MNLNGRAICISFEQVEQMEQHVQRGTEVQVCHLGDQSLFATKHDQPFVEPHHIIFVPEPKHLLIFY